MVREFFEHDAALLVFAEHCTEDLRFQRFQFVFQIEKVGSVVAAAGQCDDDAVGSGGNEVGIHKLDEWSGVKDDKSVPRAELDFEQIRELRRGENGGVCL